MNAANDPAAPVLPAFTQPAKEGYFQPTDLLIVLRGQGHGCSRRVFIPSAQAIGWDCPDTDTNATIYSETHGLHTYCEIEIVGRTERKHYMGNGVAQSGYLARVKFTVDETEPCAAVIWATKA